MQQAADKNIKNRFAGIDWALLLFIVLAVNVKIYVKLAALVLYLLYLLFFKKVKLERKLPGFVKFYLVIIAAGMFSSICSGAFSDSRYWFGFGWGILQWLCAAGIGYASLLCVKNTSSLKLEKTITAFFVLNMIVCLINLLSIAVSLGNFPYWYPDPAGQYGVSTGDHIQSIFQSNSITNAAVSLLGALYFINNKRFVMAFLCMITGLLSTSNVTLLFFVFMLITSIIVVKERKVKIGILLLLLSTGLVYVTLSPANFLYMNTVAGDVVKEQEPEAKKEKRKIKKIYTIPVKDSILSNVPAALIALKSAPSQIPGVAFDTTTAKILLSKWYNTPLNKTPVYNYKKPLKLYATKQTLSFWVSDLRHFFLGAGIGNYSSKLALKMTGLGFEGSYPGSFTYANKDFIQHTFHTLMYIYTQPVSQHSVINTPRNIYNQLAGEYGLLGVLVIIFFYAGYIFSNWKLLWPGGIILVGFTALLFGFEYWFEAMSLTVVFELLIMKRIEHADK
jgi:hypothetical protein